MKRFASVIALIAILAVGVAACGTTPAPATAPADTLAPAPSAVPIQPTAIPPTQPAETAAAPTQAPTEATVAPTAEPAPAVAVANTLRLPDLKGRTVVAVTGNDYTPLNFVDPATGKAVGWEYDAI